MHQQHRMVLVAAALFATIQSLGAAEIAPSRSAQSAEALPGPPAEARRGCCRPRPPTRGGSVDANAFVRLFAAAVLVTLTMPVRYESAERQTIRVSVYARGFRNP